MVKAEVNEGAADDAAPAGAGGSGGSRSAGDGRTARGAAAGGAGDDRRAGDAGGTGEAAPAADAGGGEVGAVPPAVEAGPGFGRLGADLVVGDDGLARCGWAGTDPLYCAYHDDDWGRPLRDERALFELLTLEAFQSGLSWLTILRKRPAFRAAFDGFDPEAVAAYGDAEVERLMGDAGIVRNRAKVEATIANARAVVALHEAGETFTDLVWSHAPGPGAPDRPPAGTRFASLAEIPSATPASKAMAKDLRARGFRFVGPTVAYAYMQSAGLVDDHLTGCHVTT
jgi:DNA-3-methyladenine glycosylase I